MIFRQLFDHVSSTYTYLIASRKGGEALLVDPVFEKTDRYLKLLEELDLRLVKVIDTHVHADHVTAMGALRDHTNCVTVMGEQSPVDVVSMRVTDGERVTIEGINMTALYTPGHTDDSYCFQMDDRIFTGDTLLIRGTGRTDFQNGDAGAQYDSLFGRLLSLPEQTLIYPAHDYKGDMVSTIGEEKAYNPRLQVSSRAAYIELMNNLNLPNPKMMDVAVPENIKMGITMEAQKQVSHVDADKLAAMAQDDFVLIDLREEGERARHGAIAGAVHAPYSQFYRQLDVLGAYGAKPLIFYCAAGERSAMAVRLAQDKGFNSAAHLLGGYAAWQEGGFAAAR
jgi:glyoxylase-like metal-dependent hydrolase (beta-lactamase superfamily II)/rhodanese-related sulfurtransferase